MKLYDDELEEMIIGNVLVEGRMSFEDRRLSTSDFFFPENSQVWAVMCELDEEDEQIEPVDVHHRCKQAYPNFNLKISDLSKIAVKTPGITRAKDVQRIREMSVARRLQKSFTNLAEKLADASVREVIGEAENLLTLTKKESGTDGERVKKLVEVMEFEVYPILDKFVTGEAVKIPFGFSRLDDATNGGVGLGELVVLGAKPKSGKSALVLQMATHHANVGFPSLIVSREMLNSENGMRFLAQNSRYSNNVFRPYLMAQTAESLKEVGRKYTELSLFLDDRSKKVSEIRREAKLLKETEGLKSVFVDYAQLIRPEVRKNNRAEDLEAVYYDLKDMAQELELAVYVNAQFNREGIKSERPKMSDFDGSSAAEKAGNLILLWKVNDEYSSLEQGKLGTLWIEAGRNVATDEFNIIFQGQHSRFMFS